MRHRSQNTFIARNFLHRPGQAAWDAVCPQKAVALAAHGGGRKKDQVLRQARYSCSRDRSYGLVGSWVMSTTGGNCVLFVDVPEKWLTHRYVSPPVLPVIPRVGIENSGRRLCERMTMPRSVRAGVPECSQTDSMQHPKSQTITTSPLEQSVKTSPGCSRWLAWGGMGPI